MEKQGRAKIKYHLVDANTPSVENEHGLVIQQCYQYLKGLS